MILIQSSESDSSTNDVLDWIRFLFPQQAFQRIDDESRVEKLVHRISNSKETLQLKAHQSDKIELESITSWWYRRGYFAFPHVRHDIKSRRSSEISFAFDEFLEKEYDAVEAAIDKTLAGLTNSINCYHDNNTNKITNLAIAARLNLKIPETIITNDVSELRAFYNEYRPIVTKAMFRNFLRIDFGKEYSVGFSCDTTLVTNEDINRIESYQVNEVGLPGLFQQYIDKSYELRIFCFKGKFYSMAVFSQSNPKTQIDMRNYDNERPNRCVPYQLPKVVEEKIRNLLSETRIKSGSIDMIVTPEKEYVFLEINPVGKYQWLRENCNYDIDEIIAKSLADK